MRPLATPLAFAFAIAFAACPALAEEPKGRFLVSIGICNDSIVDDPVLWMRKVDKSAHRRVFGPTIFGSWDYADELGRFKVVVDSLAAGEWEIFNHEMRSRPEITYVKHRSRLDYSHRFTIEPGKVVDLGRYCAATQSTGDVYEDSKDRVFNQVVRLAYMIVSPSREADVEAARSSGGEVPLEPVQARPNPPERVSPLLRSRYIEPRVIKTPVQKPPGDPFR